jgi:hypothetical protein
MDGAVITQVDGLPCFTVPDNRETRDGVPLSSVTVTKNNPPGATTLPETVWITRVQPRGKTILWTPQQCVRYGVSPPSAKQEQSSPLQPYQIYAVMFKAIPAGSNLRGYHAEFCMVPDVAEKLQLQVVPWDEKASAWRYELCAPRAK